MPLVNKPDLMDSIMFRQHVGPKCRFGLKFRVTEPNLEIRWRFRALKGKMTFAIYKQKLLNQDHAENDIIPELLENTDNGSLKGDQLALQVMMEDTLRKFSYLSKKKRKNDKDLKSFQNFSFIFLALNDDSATNEFSTDPSNSMEVAREAETIPSSKDYTIGKIPCEYPFDYLLVLSNPCQIFPSTTILHLVDLISENAPPSSHNCVIGN